MTTKRAPGPGYRLERKPLIENPRGVEAGGTGYTWSGQEKFVTTRQLAAQVMDSQVKSVAHVVGYHIAKYEQARH
jgi:hypothetical protein